MEKYFKIGEISKLYDIGVDSLRYYEEIGVILPERSESGYRLYSVNDIWRLNVIRDLRELGFGMEKIKGYLNCHNTEATLKLLQEEKTTIENKIKRLEALKRNVVKRMKTVAFAQQLPLGEITLRETEERRCFSITEGYSDEHEMDILIKRLLNIDKNRFYIIGNNQIGTAVSLDEARQNGRLKYKSVFIIDENGTDILPRGRYLSVSYKGEYEQSRDWIQRLLRYAAEHKLVPKGDILELLWIDIHCSSDTDEHITELQIAVE